MDDQEQNDPVWKLLSHARKVEPAPFFARNVVRQIRQLETEPLRFWNRLSQWLSGRVLIVGTAACAALAVTLMVISESPRSTEDGAGFTMTSIAEFQGPETFDPASELASIEYLGQLMAVADPGQLDDGALADLFY